MSRAVSLGPISTIIEYVFSALPSFVPLSRRIEHFLELTVLYLQNGSSLPEVLPL